MDNMYLISLLRAAVNDAAPENPPENIDWKAMYALADRHSVTAAVYYAAMKLPEEYRPDGEVQKAFKRRYQLAIGIESMQHYEMSEVMEEFEKNKIPYVPLKGWIIKNLYKVPYIRTMCDVDILVNKCDVTRVRPILKNRGFIRQGPGANHDGYLKSGNIATEIHWDLFVSNSPYYKFFADIMERTVSAGEGTYRRYLTKEDFFLHMIAHLAKHFDGAGTGIRSFMDIYLYTREYGSDFNRDIIEKGLSELGLDKFAEIMCDAAYAWFSEEEKEHDRYREIMDYVLYTGTYGNADTRIISGLEQNYGNKFKYMIRRFFPDRISMEWQFPILKKLPFLIVFCYIIRGIRSVLFRREKMRDEFRTVKSANTLNIKNMEDIKRMSGL